MNKTLIIFYLIISYVCSNCRSNEAISNQQIKSSNDVEFCAVLANPENYKAKILQIKAVIRGYHSYILYNENCCAVDKVVNAQGIDYEMRRKMAEKINEVYAGNAKSDFSGEITIWGKLEDNDIKPIYPKQPFKV